MRRKIQKECHEQRIVNFVGRSKWLTVLDTVERLRKKEATKRLRCFDMNSCGRVVGLDEVVK